MQAAQARPPYVTFEVKGEEDREATIESGIYVVKDVDFAIITPQGSKDRIERKVSEWFPQLQQQVSEGRFEQAWLDSFRAKYKAWKDGQEMPEDGYPVANWPAASPSQVKTMLAGGVRTIEDMANANEETLTRLGMGARALKDRAKAWLESAKDVGAQSERVAALAQENEDLKAQLAQLTQQVASLVEASKTGKTAGETRKL